MLKRRFASILACSVLLLMGSNATFAAECLGLTPGFWFNNIDKHKGKALPKGVSGSNLVANAGLSGFTALSGDATTIKEALFSSAGGGEEALMRHAVAAYLNAMHPLVNYPIASAAQVSSAANFGIQTGDPITVELLKDQLDAYNNLGCSLNHKGELSYD
jgi:hypothetical protein